MQRPHKVSEENQHRTPLELCHTLQGVTAREEPVWEGPALDSPSKQPVEQGEIPLPTSLPPDKAWSQTCSCQRSRGSRGGQVRSQREPLAVPRTVPLLCPSELTAPCAQSPPQELHSESSPTKPALARSQHLSWSLGRLLAPSCAASFTTSPVQAFPHQLCLFPSLAQLPEQLHAHFWSNLCKKTPHYGMASSSINPN